MDHPRPIRQPYEGTGRGRSTRGMAIRDDGPQRDRSRTYSRQMTDETATKRRSLLERFSTGFAAVADALDGADDEDLDRRGPSGEWSAREIAHHLADSESMAYIRLRRLIAEDEPVIAGYDEPEWARRLHYERPIETSLEVLQAVRGASQQLLMSLTPDEWERRGTHTESGAYSVDRWLEIYAEHSHEHADQIRRARRGED
jgi:hypothetical protein